MMHVLGSRFFVFLLITRNKVTRFSSLIVFPLFSIRALNFIVYFQFIFGHTLYKWSSRCFICCNACTACFKGLKILETQLNFFV